MRPRKYIAWKYLTELLAASVVVCLLVGAAVLKMRRVAAEQAMNDAAGAVEFLARKLHEKSASEQLPEKIDPEQAAGIDDGYRFAGGHFDHYGYTITINGSHPAYAGTTVAYHGRDQQAPITLTVQDLSSKRWIVEQEPLPKWWAVWK